MRALIAAAVVVVPMGLAVPVLAQAEGGASSDREVQPKSKAEVLVEEYAAVEMPTYNPVLDRENPGTYRAEYTKKYNEALAIKAEIGKKLLAADATPEQLMAVMPDRWSIMTARLGDQSVLEETRRFMGSQHKALAAESLYAHAAAMSRFRTGTVEERIGAARAFHQASPEDERFVRVMGPMAEDTGVDEATRIGLYKEMMNAFPKSRFTAYYPGKIRQIEGLNKPFELTFSDANTGETVSMHQLRGKVVIVDFWATWCGPCIAEIPNLKKLYEEYKDKGVEIVAVSLDQPEDKGGLEKLRKYCEENELTWPQYYQGNYWQSEFSTSWGINSIPAVFVIDKHGNLHSTKGRGHLETMVPELLAKPGPQG